LGISIALSLKGEILYGEGMKKLLHIIATPRGDESRTLQVSGPFLDVFQKEHPEYVIDELNLAKEQLPPLTAMSVSGKYVLMNGKDIFGSLRDTWGEILQYIEQFKSSDIYLISTPMWNFHIPYPLKHFIDLIVQPKYLFRYTETGVEGLIKNKKMIVITSRGGQYTSEATRELDFQEPYLRAIFGFVGITDITFIKAEGMDLKDAKRKQRLEDAISSAKKLAKEAF
jgi:FMN-dependent NADH-azoreductase